MLATETEGDHPAGLAAVRFLSAGSCTHIHGASSSLLDLRTGRGRIAQGYENRFRCFEGLRRTALAAGSFEPRHHEGRCATSGSGMRRVFPLDFSGHEGLGNDIGM